MFKFVDVLIILNEKSLVIKASLLLLFKKHCFIKIFFHYLEFCEIILMNFRGLNNKFIHLALIFFNFIFNFLFKKFMKLIKFSYNAKNCEHLRAYKFNF